MESSASPIPAAPPAAYPLCAKCGAELHGPHCYSCGQPVKGMVRPLSSMLHDVADTIFNIDSRIFRTLLPLYFRPGYLSNEYFSGRRVRYVTPFRLYFFMSVAAFLLMQIGLDSSFDAARDAIHLGETNSGIASARTPEDVLARRDKELARLDQALNVPVLPAEARTEIENEQQAIRKQAQKRLDKLAARKAENPGTAPAPADAAKAPGDVKQGAPKKADANKDDDDLDFHGWDPNADPVHVAWLPAFVNAKLTNAAVRMRDNVPRIKQDPKPFLIGAFGMLPQVLFVLMPLFALLLKIFYLFKRRLYMEHLIVALHSHAFVFLSLIFITLAILLRSWARGAAPWLEMPLGWLIFVMCWWLPLYLLLTAKKVYKQGWIFTTLKFCVIGICYTVMISLGIAAAFMISLATT